MAQNWYSGYKANIVTYTLAKFAQMVSAKHKYIDFMAIWKTQKLSTTLETQLLSLAKAINDTITDTDLNVTQYCKQQACWQSGCNELEVLSELLARGERRSKRMQNEVKNPEESRLRSTYLRKAKYWSAMMEWGDSTGILLDSEISFLTAFIQGQQQRNNARK